MRSVAARSKKPASAKTSTKSARPSAATTGIIVSATWSAYSAMVPASGGTAWAPRNVVTTRIGSPLATRRSRRRWRSSSSSDRPYPDLHSTVVVPAPSAARNRSSTSGASVASSAARVAPTVRRMPPSVYGAPSSRAAVSSDRSPAKTGWVWLSTRPGVTSPGPRSSRSPSSASTGSPIQAMRPSSMRMAQGECPPGARRPVPTRSIGQVVLRPVMLGA